MRAYSTVVAAAALRVERRWLDDVVVEHRIEGVQRQHQGVSRAISPAAVLTIAVALELMGSMAMPVARALHLAGALLGGGGQCSLADGLVIQLDVGAIERRMASRLTEAVESHPPPRRGRPPRRG